MGTANNRSSNTHSDSKMENVNEKIILDLLKKCDIPGELIEAGNYRYTINSKRNNYDGICDFAAKALIEKIEENRPFRSICKITFFIEKQTIVIYVKGGK